MVNLKVVSKVNNVLLRSTTIKSRLSTVPQQSYQQNTSARAAISKPPAHSDNNQIRVSNQAPAQGQQPAPMAEPDFDFDDDIPF
jgi:single-strand DNA-binding protein